MAPRANTIETVAINIAEAGLDLPGFNTFIITSPISDISPTWCQSSIGDPGQQSGKTERPPDGVTVLPVIAEAGQSA
jgi:hypothetical protein